VRKECLKLLPKDFQMFDSKVPLKIKIYHYYEFRKTERKAIIKAGAPTPKISKPDVTDNLNKALVDAMADLVYEQDQQIFSCLGEKYWWKRNAISVRIQAL